MVKLQCQRSRFVTDERIRLTWKGLFRDVDNTVNFYSTRDEVVANGDGSWKWHLTRKFAWYSPYAELYGEGGSAFLQANPYVLWYALSHGIPAAAQSGSDAAGSRVSMEVAGVALGRRDVLSRRVWNGRLKLAKHRPQR